NKS
ncbi:hypothetical protein MIMGU_mgv1a0093162mg, partial [Erythranthe guttata]